MTKIQKHTIDLHTPKTDALEAAQAELEQLNAQTERLSALALAGNLGADTLADHTDRINLATMRLEAARASVKAELEDLAEANSIADAIAELLQDESVSTTAVERSIENLREAISAVQQANQQRNASIVAWAERLRALGIPDAGLTVNDDEIRILSQGVTGTTIVVGAGRVATIPSVAGHIRHVTSRFADAHMPIDPANLPSADTRGRAQAETVAVRLTRPLGGRAVGDVLTTRTHALGVLAQMVHTGNAELVEGTVPDQSAHKRTYFLGDTSLLPDPQRVTTLRNVHDDATVEAAVTKAFAN